MVTAIRAGKHVLCEKPLATTAEDCLAILTAEQEAGRKLVTVGFMRRFDVGYGQMKDVLESGDLGQPTLVHCRHRNPSVPAKIYTTRNMIDDTAIHEIDTCRFLLDEEMMSVRVDTPRRSSLAPEGLQDPLVMVAKSAAGVLVDVEVNVNIQFGYSIECELVMESGAVRLGDQEKSVIRDGNGNRNAICRSHIDRFHDAFNAEVQSWIRAVEEGQHTGSSAWDGYAATCVVDAAVAFLEDGGQEVAVDMIEKPDLYV
ncbi:Inositol 2-dehydrogenase [Cutibacterium acnes subsp. elongatum]